MLDIKKKVIGLRNGCQPLEDDQIVMFHINYWTATYQFCLLEPRALKGARVVPRGERTSNGPDLPDDRGDPENDVQVCPK